MTTSLVQTYKGHTVGTTFTAANSGDGGDTPFNSVAVGSGASAPLYGTDSATTALDIPLVAGTTMQCLWTGLSMTQVRLKFYLEFPTTVGASIRVLEARDTASAVMLRLLVNSSNKFLLQSNGGATTARTFANPLVAGTRYRVEMVWTKGTSGATLTMDYYVGESTTPVESYSSTTVSLATTNNTGEIRLGSGATTNTLTGHMTISDTHADDTSLTYFGPSVNSPTANAGADQTGVDPNLADTFSLDGSGTNLNWGTGATYSWEDMTTSTVVSTSLSPTDIPMVHNVQGETRTYQLTVTTSGGTSTDTCAVTFLGHNRWIMAPDGVTLKPIRRYM